MLTQKQKCEIVSARFQEISSLREKFAAERKARNVKEAKKTGDLLGTKMAEIMTTEQDLKNKLQKKFGGYFYNSIFSKRYKIHLLSRQVKDKPYTYKHVFLNSCGEDIFGREYDHAMPFSEGLAFVKDGEAGYFIDESGRKAINAYFDTATIFYNGYSQVSVADRGFVIDRTGRQVTKRTYKGVLAHFSYLSENYILFEENGKKMLATLDGREIDVSACESVVSFDGEIVIGKIRVKINDYHIYIDKSGKKISDEMFERANPFKDGYACVYSHQISPRDPYFFIDKKGKHLNYRDKKSRRVLARAFIDAKSFSEGLAAVKQENGKWNFMTTQGELLSQNGFDRVSDFSEGVAAVSVGQKYFFIDKQGQQVGTQTFDFAGSFSNGKAKVHLNNKRYEIDHEGNLTEEKPRAGRPDGPYRGAAMLNPDIFSESDVNQ